MVTLLRKIFIKDYKNVTNEKTRNAHGKLAAAFGIVSNAFLFAIKLAFGILANSVSIIADSVNNLSDFGNSTITLVGFKMANKPADKEHPFGHQRIEYISGLMVSIVIVALAVLLMYNSIVKIISGDSATYDIISFIILGIAVVLKLIQAYFNFAISKIIKSVALKATAIDSLTDSIATFILLVSALLSYFFSWNIDGYVGIIIALFVGYSGIKMIKETSSPLIGESVDKTIINNIVNDITSYEGVFGIHDVVAHNYGPTKIFITLHVEVDSNVNVNVSHDLIDNIEHDISKKYNVQITIHMDPIDNSNPETKRLKEKCQEIVRNINKEYSIHDFRVVYGTSHNNVIFDIVVPYGVKENEQSLTKIIEEKMNENEGIKINIVLHIDHPFSER